MAAGTNVMAVNSAARLWGPFRSLQETVDTAILKKAPGAVHDLEIALKKHRPDFISLLKSPSKNAANREQVRKASTEGLPVQGEQRTQTFTPQFITEALILSDLFDINELAAVELLTAGENQLPNYPGLTRGLVAVLLWYDGRRSLVNALRTLIQAREGRTWTLGLTPDLVTLATNFTNMLVEEGLVHRILDLISGMDQVKEMDRLQRDRALGPPKHRRQVLDLFSEIRQSLAECLFCLACQNPLLRTDTLRLLAHLRDGMTLTAEGTLDTVSQFLVMALLFCFDVSVLEQEDSEEALQRLPEVQDEDYVAEIHRALTAEQSWTLPGLRGAVQLAWALTLRQLSQYPMAAAMCQAAAEDDEILVDLAIEAEAFAFLRLNLACSPHFHQEEFFLRRLHSIVSDFIFHMPLKVKELRNRGDETARLILAHKMEGLEAPPQRRDFEDLLLLIGELYREDPLGLELALEYWCPSEPSLGQDTFHYRPPPRQMALFKFVRLAGDLLPAPLYIPYISMLTGLAASPQCAQHCFNLLKMNGGSASTVSWDHIFSSLSQYYTSLRREAPTSSDAVHHRGHVVKSITPQEVDGLAAVLRLLRRIAQQSEPCRNALCESQQWSAVLVVFGLVSCAVATVLKAELLLCLAALARSPAIAASLWQTLELSQILTTIPSSSEHKSGLQVELEEIESRNEEYPMTQAFLQLLKALITVPIPAGLGAGFRVPGFDPYLSFVISDVLLQFHNRGYRNAKEKWEVAGAAMSVLVGLLSDYEVGAEEGGDRLVVEMAGGATLAVAAPPGYTIMVHMLSDSRLVKMILRVLDDSIRQLELYQKSHDQGACERLALLCLRMLELTLEREEQFQMLVRDSGSPKLLSSMAALLSSLNPRSRQADYITSITKFVMFNDYLPEHALAAVRILHMLCLSAPIQTDLVTLFTMDERMSTQLLSGFVECLEADDAELETEESEQMLLGQSPGSEPSVGEVRNQTRQHILQLMLHAMSQPAPNLAHWLLGFHTRKPVSKTNLQDPGILGSQRNCLHAVLKLLTSGMGSQSAPDCLQRTPRLADLCFQLVYTLSANRDTSAPTLRYLRTSHDFLYRQLQHLPTPATDPEVAATNAQSWLLKTVAIELRITALNRQRSHTQRLMRLLLGDEQDDQTAVLQPYGGDDAESGLTFAKDPGWWQHSSPRQLAAVKGQQMRRKLLCLLDMVSLEQSYPTPLQLDFFEPRLVEGVMAGCERQGQGDLAFCDVKQLRRILVSELNAQQQGSALAGQRPLIEAEILQILRCAVERNAVRATLARKRTALEAWRQVAEVLLTACPEDLLPGESRQSLIFELLQELLLKVTSDSVAAELASPVAGVVLTLMANLRHCFLAEAPPHHQEDTFAQNAGSATASTPLSGSTNMQGWGSVSGSGSRTLFATSLQTVLRGLLDYILKSGGSQRVRANLYGALLYFLQIAQKPASRPGIDAGATGVEKVLGGTLEAECELLARENMASIMSYGDSFQEVVCRDACDGHDIGKMLALSVLDTLLLWDAGRQWTGFLSSRGYLAHLVDSLVTEDQALRRLLGPDLHQIRALYIYLSKMSLLTRLGETAEGAHLLLRCGVMQKLSACTCFSMRPEAESVLGERGVEVGSGEDFLPSPLARYRQLLSAALRLCLAILTTGVENRDAAAQVMLFVVSHADAFNSVLRCRKLGLDLSALKELSLVTAVVARANFHVELGSEFLESETAMVEFRGHQSRLQRQMMELLPLYALSERGARSLRGRSGQRGEDLGAEVVMATQEIAANLVAYCRALLTQTGASSQFSRILFGPSLEEAAARDLNSAEDLPAGRLVVGPMPSLGVVVFLMRQCAAQFSSVFDSHRLYLQKLNSLPDLSSDDLKELAVVSGVEKMSSGQRQDVAGRRLQQLVSNKARELQHLSYLVENCLFIVWRHLEYFLLHCVPVDQQPLYRQSQTRRLTQMRRLQDLTGITRLEEEEREVEPDNFSHGITREEIQALKQVAPTAISESLLKKVQEINQCYVKSRTHYNFTEAIIRRIKRLLRLHSGN